MEKILSFVEELSEEILNEKFKLLSELDIPKRQGVYIVKENSGKLFNNMIFYVGKSINLNNRIMNRHAKHGSILRKKLSKWLASDEKNYYLVKECLWVIKEINDFDVNSLVESSLIAYLRKQGEPLLNAFK